MSVNKNTTVMYIKEEIKEEISCPISLSESEICNRSDDGGENTDLLELLPKSSLLYGKYNFHAAVKFLEVNQSPNVKPEDAVKPDKTPSSATRLPIICRLCGRPFIDRTLFVKHVTKTHTVDEVPTCFICGKRCRKFAYNNLKEHMRTHTKEKPFRCDICGDSFGLSGTLQRHAATHLTERPYKEYKCTLCSVTFTYHHLLRRHYAEHVVSKVSMSSSSKDDKLKHRSSLSTGTKGINPSGTKQLKQKIRKKVCSSYQCVVCGKSFTAKESLQRHVKIHTGGKRHQCKECGKTFTRLNTLNNHLKMHTGEKLPECSVCGKAFAAGSMLREHFRIHTGEKPFQCQICGKAFSQSASLRKHTMQVHTKNELKCEICVETFSSSKSLKRHYLQAHNSENLPISTIIENLLK